MASAEAVKDKAALIPRIDTAGETPVLWYATGVRARDLMDCQLHPPKLEMTVTGRTRRIRDPKRPKLGRTVVIDEQEVVLFRYGNRIFATGARCPHMQGRIEGGDIEDLASHGGPAKSPERVPRAGSLGIGSDFDDDFDDDTAAATKHVDEPGVRLCITCPVHGFQFDASSGISVMPPDSFYLPVYHTRIADAPANGSACSASAAVSRSAASDLSADGLDGEVEVGITDFDPEASDVDF